MEVRGKGGRRRISEARSLLREECLEAPRRRAPARIERAEDARPRVHEAAEDRAVEGKHVDDAADDDEG